MSNMTGKQPKFVVSHAPFLHDGSRISTRSYNMMLAAVPAVLMGIFQYGGPAFAVIAFSISTAMIWEFILTTLSKRKVSIGDGNAALIGLLLGMMLPPVTPFWVVAVGTLVAVSIGKHIYGGIGGNPFNPVILGYSVLLLSWPNRLDPTMATIGYIQEFSLRVPLFVLKYFGVEHISSYQVMDLLMGHQAGGIGTTFGLGLIIGGLYLILRGFIRWEISVSYIAGVFVTAFIFNSVNPESFAGPMFHLFAGFTLFGAFFLSTDDSSSPVNFLPMLIYGAGTGVLIVLIRNIGAGEDGVALAILLFNCINPLIDKIRPKAMGKVAENA